MSTQPTFEQQQARLDSIKATLAAIQGTGTQPEPVVEVPQPEERAQEPSQEYFDKLHQEELEIRRDSLKISVQELAHEVPQDVELREVKDDDSLEDQIAALEFNDKSLRDALNQNIDSGPADEDTDEPLASTKFGKFNGPLVSINTKAGLLWLDVDGVDIDSGTQYQITSAIQKKIDAAKKAHGNAEFAKVDRKKKPHEVYGITQEEYELESEKEYPVFNLPAQDGPKWDDSILFGFSGEIVRKASQYCESHPAGMLVDLLVSIGSIIGRGPYFNIGATQHFTNEFMCRVGPSSKGRKGTGRDETDSILKLVDHKWYVDRVLSGFGSGEAIVNECRDSVSELRQAKPGGPFQEHVVRGVDDKRLCIRDGELSALFNLCSKEGNASEIVRNGWDGKVLRNIVKGRDKNGNSNSTKCEEPHLSISGDTTLKELRLKMPEGAESNGFANRFLYLYGDRVKNCPNGGPQLDWSKEIPRLHQIIQAARTVKYVSMTEPARKWWNRCYTEVENNPLDGLVGQVTARATAHIRRIAMLYTLLDIDEYGLGGDQTETRHFVAALKLWRYCEESALFIFGGGVNKEQLRILEFVGKHGSATYQQIRDDLYQRHKPAEQIRSNLAALVHSKQLNLTKEKYSKP